MDDLTMRRDPNAPIHQTAEGPLMTAPAAIPNVDATPVIKGPGEYQAEQGMRAIIDAVGKRAYGHFGNPTVQYIWNLDGSPHESNLHRLHFRIIGPYVQPRPPEREAFIAHTKRGTLLLREYDPKAEKEAREILEQLVTEWAAFDKPVIGHRIGRALSLLFPAPRGSGTAQAGGGE